eukprot:5126676-Pleurochrysis_carterae.AAC.1
MHDAAEAQRRESCESSRLICCSSRLTVCELQHCLTTSIRSDGSLLKRVSGSEFRQECVIYSIRMKLLDPATEGGLSKEERGFETAQLRGRHWVITAANGAEARAGEIALRTASWPVHTLQFDWSVAAVRSRVSVSPGAVLLTFARR